MSIKRELPICRTTYAKCVEPSDKMNEDNDCSVKAVAIAGRTTYNIAHALLKAAGRKDRKGCRVSLINSVLEEGLSTTLRDMPMEVLRKRRGGGLTSNNIHTVLNKQRTYIAYTRDHVLTIRNGKLEDWTDGRRFRVLRVLEVSLSK